MHTILNKIHQRRPPQHGPMPCLQAKLAEAGSAEISIKGATHTIRADMVTIERVSKAGRNFTPSVIEPSFGIGRILYCIFEHTFYMRSDDAQKTVFKFSPTVAPMKTTVFPLLQRKELNDVATSISLDLRRAGLSSIIDTTGTCYAYLRALFLAWAICRCGNMSVDPQADATMCTSVIGAKGIHSTLSGSAGKVFTAPSADHPHACSACCRHHNRQAVCTH
jgi:hypothetical protein